MRLDVQERRQLWVRSWSQLLGRLNDMQNGRLHSLLVDPLQDQFGSQLGLLLWTDTCNRVNDRLAGEHP